MSFNRKLDKLTDKTKERCAELEPEERFRQYVGGGPEKQRMLMETIPDATYRMPDADHAGPIRGFHRAVEGWLVLWKSAAVDYMTARGAVSFFEHEEMDAFSMGDEEWEEKMADHLNEAHEATTALAEKLAGIYAGLQDWLAEIDVEEETFWTYLGPMADGIQVRIEQILEPPVEPEPDPETREVAYEVLAERGPE